MGTILTDCHLGEMIINLSNMVNCISYSPDYKIIAAGTCDNSIILIDA